MGIRSDFICRVLCDERVKGGKGDEEEDTGKSRKKPLSLMYNHVMSVYLKKLMVF